MNMFHTASLVIDDIEDGSALRRGVTASHVKFGVPSSLNASCWVFFEALRVLLELPIGGARSLDVQRIMLEELCQRTAPSSPLTPGVSDARLPCLACLLQYLPSYCSLLRRLVDGFADLSQLA